MELKFDENIQIIDFEIVNVEIVDFQKIQKETQIIDDHYYRNEPGFFRPENVDYYNQVCNEESLYFRKLLFERYGF